MLENVLLRFQMWPAVAVKERNETLVPRKKICSQLISRLIMHMKMIKPITLYEEEEGHIYIIVTFHTLR